MTIRQKICAVFIRKLLVSNVLSGIPHFGRCWRRPGRGFGRLNVSEERKWFRIRSKAGYGRGMKARTEKRRGGVGVKRARRSRAGARTAWCRRSAAKSGGGSESVTLGYREHPSGNREALGTWSRHCCGSLGNLDRSRPRRGGRARSGHRRSGEPRLLHFRSDSRLILNCAARPDDTQRWRRQLGRESFCSSITKLPTCQRGLCRSSSAWRPCSIGCWISNAASGRCGASALACLDQSSFRANRRPDRRSTSCPGGLTIQWRSVSRSDSGRRSGYRAACR